MQIDHEVDYSRRIERLSRDINLLRLENRRLIEKVSNYDKASIYLNKRNETLCALERALPQRIEKYKQKNAPKCLIKELEVLMDMLSMEKEKTLEKEEE